MLSCQHYKVWGSIILLAIGCNHAVSPEPSKSPSSSMEKSKPNIAASKGRSETYSETTMDEAKVPIPHQPIIPEFVNDSLRSKLKGFFDDPQFGTELQQLYIELRPLVSEQTFAFLEPCLIDYRVMLESNLSEAQLREGRKALKISLLRMTNAYL